MNASRVLVRTTVILIGVMSVVPGLASADIVFTPRVSYYFDNFNALDSSVSADPSYVKNMIDQLNSQLKSALGPTASIAMANSSIALKTQQAAYKLYGASIDGRWGQGDRLYATFLTGTANVQAYLLQQATFDTTYLSSSAQDLSTSSEVTNSSLRRFDVELVYEHNDFTAGIRLEREKEHFVGQQVTTMSQNFENLVGASIGAQPTFNLASLQGTSQGDITYNVYSARAGASLHTAKIEESKNDFSLSAQLQVSYSPAAYGHGELAAAGQASVPLVIQGTTDSSWSAGPDVSVGYTYRFAHSAALDLRYRAIVYFPIHGELSGTQKSSDPRVNQGLNVGISYFL